MVRFKRKKIYSRAISLMVFLYLSTMALVVVFVNLDNSVILGTAALTESQTDNIFNSAALILSNTNSQNIIFWALIIIITTLLAFLLGRYLDKRFGKYYCVNCVHKNTHISVKNIK
jgi:hypothetical protein